MPPPLDNQRCRERYERAGYGQVMSCPLQLAVYQVRPIGECYHPGESKEVDGKTYWAIDSICFDKKIQAFAAEFEGQYRRYMKPELALKAMAQWEREGNQRGYLERGDLLYAQWLAAYKCAKWKQVVENLRQKEKELNNQ